MTRHRRVSATRGGMSHDTLSFSALMGNVHWNRYTDQSNTIKGMGWSTKSLTNNCWQFFVRFSLPPGPYMSGLEKYSLNTFLGAYGSLPDAAIWWCLRTGGGGVLTRPPHPKLTPAILVSPHWASSRFWQCSRRGISLVPATAKPES
jgi:hypothetical protein